MGVQAPPRLLELAVQSLLWNEALALEKLSIELFPLLFTVAFAGRHTQALKAMVQAFALFLPPTGGPDEGPPASTETFQAALSGLDVVLAQEVFPR